MPDWMDPDVVLATNPYLAQSQPLDKWSVLGNLLMGAGAGISQADESGRGWASGIAPGLMMGMQLVNNARRQADDEAMRRAQFARMLEYSRTQDEAKRRGAFGNGAFGPYQSTQPTWDAMRAAAQRLKALNGKALSAAGIPADPIIAPDMRGTR